MGGRGASSGVTGGGGGIGAYGGFGTFVGLVGAANDNINNGNLIPANPAPGSTGGYTDGNNPNLVKYQGQEDDKTANFLASTDRTVDLNNDPQYNDGYSYHDIPLNRLLARLGVNKGPTVLSESQFKQYVQQTGQQVMYRGWSSSDSAQRFLNTTNNHVGNGVMGDGYYFSPDRSTAISYSGSMRTGNGEIMKVALSPNARVVDRGAVQAAIAAASPKLRSALHKAGHYGSGRTYSGNSGEAQMALKMGYNVIQSGNYLVAITNDALVVSRKTF